MELVETLRIIPGIFRQADTLQEYLFPREGRTNWSDKDGTCYLKDLAMMVNRFKTAEGTGMTDGIFMTKKSMDIFCRCKHLADNYQQKNR